MPKTKKFLFYFLYFLIFEQLVLRVFLSHDTRTYFTFIEDFCCYYVFLKIVMQKHKVVNNEITKITGDLVILFILLFLSVGSLSSVMFENKFITWLWGIHIYLRYPILFYNVFKLFNKDDIEKVKKIFFRMIKVNIFVILIQRFVFGIQGDYLGGTFEGNSQFLNFLLPCLYFFIADFMNGKYKLLHMFFMVIAVMLYAKWGEVKAIYFILPALLLSSYVIFKKFTSNLIVGVCLASILIIPASEFVLGIFMGDSYVERVFNLNYVQKETSNESGWGGFNRSTCIVLTETLIFQDPGSSYIGYGFGQSNISNKFGGWIGDEFGANGVHLFTSSYVLSEVGWIGYVLFLGVYVILLLRFWEIKKHYNDDEEMRYWSSIGLISLMFNFVIIWYNHTPVSSAYFTTFLWAMCFLALKFRKKELDDALLVTKVKLFKGDEETYRVKNPSLK